MLQLLRKASPGSSGRSAVAYMLARVQQDTLVCRRTLLCSLRHRQPVRQPVLFCFRRFQLRPRLLRPGFRSLQRISAVLQLKIRLKNSAPPGDCFKATDIL